MIARPLVAAAVAAVAVAGTASAASLTIGPPPTLANIVVNVPACDDVTSSSVPITWTPERVCDNAATDVDPVSDEQPNAEPEAVDSAEHEAAGTGDEATTDTAPLETHEPVAVPGDDETSLVEPEEDTPDA